MDSLQQMNEILDYVVGRWDVELRSRWTEIAGASGVDAWVGGLRLEHVVWMLDWVWVFDWLWMLGSCCIGFSSISSIAGGEDPLIVCVSCVLCV